MDTHTTTPADKTKKSKTNFKTKTARAKAKLLSAYYGNPIRDMKLIAITGTTGKSTVAHFVHEILRAAGQHVAILASDTPIKTTVLHKFLSDAWKAGANYVVVTAPAESLKDNVFYGLPVEIAALTDFVPSSLTSPSASDFLADTSTLFRMDPNYVILNENDAFFSDFSTFSGKIKTITYGTTLSSTVHIDNKHLYKKGTEVNLSIGSSPFTVASFLVGEPIVSYVACAAAVATALNFTPETIAEGLANYNPTK